MYDRGFFEDINPAALQSAEVIVPIIMRLVNPGSVIDLGCGTGVWLSVFKRSGVSTVIGVDGDYVERGALQIAPDEFLSADLAEPFFLPQTFDMALCLEVAEHLPARRARELVGSLTRLSPMVFFSAAIPGQTAPQHVNLQWPGYWAKLFMEAGYLMLDPVRPLIWQDQRVAWYYRQNCFLFARKDILEADEELRQLSEIHAHDDMLLIHRGILEVHLSLSYSMKRIPGLGLRFMADVFRNPSAIFSTRNRSK